MTSNQKGRAIVFSDRHQVEFREIELGTCGPGEIVTETLYSMVSTGTELRVLAGHYGATFPLIPGYSTVSRVMEIGAGVDQVHAGDLVSCGNPISEPGIASQWGAQSSVQRHHQNSVIKLPKESSPQDYLLVEIGGIPWRGVANAGVRPGETAIVFGQGLIGALSARFLMLAGARVTVVDPLDHRLAIAVKMGVEAAFNAKLPDLKSKLESHLPGGADIVVDASGRADVVALALPHLKRNDVNEATASRFIFQASYIEKIPFDFSAWTSAPRRVTLIFPHDRNKTDRTAVRDVIQQGRLSSADYVEKIIPVEDAPQGYRELSEHPDQHFSVAFKWK